MSKQTCTTEEEFCTIIGRDMSEDHITTADRFDEGKPRMDLIPGDALEELGMIFLEACKKYDDRNWEKGMAWSKCHASLLRHLVAWSKGEDYDPESGRLHIGHVMWNAMALVSYQKRGIGKDDRHKYTCIDEWKGK